MSGPPSVLSPAGPQAQLANEVSWVLIAGATLVFALTMVLAALAFRRRRPAVPVAWWVIGGGIVLPAVVLSVLLAYATWRTRQLDVPMPPDALVVGVTAHMWWWEFRYRDPASGRSIVLANELHIPLGRSVRLGLTSADVIHSFWVPELGGKMDMLPGRTMPLQFSADRAGVYRGQCAEFCGEQHARMALHVVVEAPEAFERWLAAQARDAVQPTDALRLRGRQAFLDHGCAACHTLRGVAESGTLGPDLTHVGSRLHLGAGVLQNHRGAMSAWLTGVQALKPGARMPAIRDLDAMTLDALSAYLASLE